MAQEKKAKNVTQDLMLNGFWYKKKKEQWKCIIYEKDLVVWARRLDDLTENLWMISCPLSLLLVASKSSESEMQTDPPDTLAAVLQPHHFLSLMWNTLQKAAELQQSLQ